MRSTRRPAAERLPFDDNSFDAAMATVTVHLPDWVSDELAGTSLRLSHVEDRLRLVNRLADRNHREGTGGPFAAGRRDPSQRRRHTGQHTEIQDRFLRTIEAAA
jgi:hypothetical protein